MNTSFDTVIDQAEEAAKEALKNWLAEVEAPEWVGKLIDALIWLSIIEHQDSLPDIKAAVGDVIQAMPDKVYAE